MNFYNEKIYCKINADIKSLANPRKAKILAKFFKTGKGEYGEGDRFLGIDVPSLRKIAKKYYQNAKLPDIRQLLKSEYHEFRLVALFMLVLKYQKATEEDKKDIFNFYLSSADRINNWDLVDSTAYHIIGNYLLDKEDRSILFTLAKSKNLWCRRIAIMATYSFIKHGKFQDTFKLAEILLKDEHDLIHKAVGWMLREAGKRNETILLNFLNKNYKNMPRTMLRYAIEKLSSEKRLFYLSKLNKTSASSAESQNS